MITPFVQVETYSTMNFATLGPSLLRPPFTGASVAGSPVIRSPTSLTFRHWAGVSPHILSYDFAETCVFDKQFHESFHCDPPVRGHPFFRSYGASLPSSLERVLSRPLVFSTNLPVSVSGTGDSCVFFLKKWCTSFSRKHNVIGAISDESEKRDHVSANRID